jgi:hypothetical protein
MNNIDDTQTLHSRFLGETKNGKRFVEALVGENTGRTGVVLDKGPVLPVEIGSTVNFFRTGKRIPNAGRFDQQNEKVLVTATITGFGKEYYIELYGATGPAQSKKVRRAYLEWDES